MTTTTDNLAEALRDLLAHCDDRTAYNATAGQADARRALAAYDAERASVAREPAGAHAREPWQVITEINSGRALQIWCADEWEICEMSRGDDSARRIVACVNACAGIPTEALERGEWWKVGANASAELRAQAVAVIARNSPHVADAEGLDDA